MKKNHFPRYLHQPVSRSQKINQRLSRSQWEVPILEYFHCAKQLQIDGHHFSPCPNVLRRGSGGLNRHEPSISHFILSNPTYLGSLSDTTTISWNGNIAIDFHGKNDFEKRLSPHTYNYQMKLRMSAYTSNNQLHRCMTTWHNTENTKRVHVFVRQL